MFLLFYRNFLAEKILNQYCVNPILKSPFARLSGKRTYNLLEISDDEWTYRLSYDIHVGRIARECCESSRHITRYLIFLL